MPVITRQCMDCDSGSRKQLWAVFGSVLVLQSTAATDAEKRLLLYMACISGASQAVLTIDMAAYNNACNCMQPMWFAVITQSTSLAWQPCIQAACSA